MYIIFICCLLFVLYEIAELTKKRGFDNLRIYRKLDRKRAFQNQEFKLITTIENDKKFPISFIYVKEKLPLQFNTVQKKTYDEIQGFKFIMSKYKLWSYERNIRTVALKCTKRGVYNIKDIKLTIGDIFGFSTIDKEVKDYKEIVIYPEINNINNYKFSSTSLYGDNIIKRWIYKDPLYIRGIREYRTGDILRDIHWLSTAKMNKLMVKEYDYTSERELVIIINVECGDMIRTKASEDEIESAISITASLAAQSIRLGINTGVWTNAKINGDIRSKIQPSMHCLNKILELCARMYCMRDKKLIDILKENFKELKSNCTYIIIGANLDEESSNFLYELGVKGIDIILIDVSSDLKLPKIKGIEKIDFKGDE